MTGRTERVASGGDFASALVPIMPPAPPRLSTNTFWPSFSPAEFEKFIAAEIAKWGRVIKAGGIKAQ